MSDATTAETLEQSYRRLAAALTRFAATVVGVDEASDVVATAVARCLRIDWSSVDNPDAFLYRATLNEARTMKRRLSRVVRLQAGDLPAPMSAAIMPDIPERLLVHEHVRRLPLQQRAVLVLTYWEGLPTHEIAKVIGVSEGTIKKQLARARARIRNEYNNESAAADYTRE